jgi:flavin reductase (DIM6/NTAB) family NADH-FMN oxidoreductase RutF
MDVYQNLETVMKHFVDKGGFLTAKCGDEVNTMTISWGFIGQMWYKPCFIAVVRPQRHTRAIMDKAADFTVSIPFGTMKNELTICGTQSGRDIDKSQVVSFIPAKSTVSPVVGGCHAYFECKINYTDQFDPTDMPKEIIEKVYKDDYHFVYMGEIVEAY